MKRILLSAVAVAVPFLCHAQGAEPTALLRQLPDSGAWRPIVTFVIQQLASDILRAARAPEDQPWVISLPDSSPPWNQVREHLVRALRARPVRAEDVSYRELQLGVLRVNGDTARAQLRTAFTQRCPGSSRVTGYGNQQEVLVARFPGSDWNGAAWSPAVLHGDRKRC